MDKVKKIKNEIESRIQECKDSKIDSSYYDGLIFAFEEVRDFINSLPEEPISEDLEEAAIEICSKVLEGETILIDGYEYVVLSDAEECFKAGANWQIKQLKRGVFIPGAKSVEFKLGEDYHISTKDFDRGKAKAYGAKEGDKIIAYFFIMDSGKSSYERKSPTALD